jgi:hypothetical protein
MRATVNAAVAALGKLDAVIVNHGIAVRTPPRALSRTTRSGTS